LVTAANGAVLQLGLTERIASRKQTRALIGRDKGCSFPGCDQPPERCQRHHVIPWWIPPTWRDPDQTPLQNHRITDGT
jgi:hypothetical protein